MRQRLLPLIVAALAPNIAEGTSTFDTSILIISSIDEVFTTAGTPIPFPAALLVSAPIDPPKCLPTRVSGNSTFECLGESHVEGSAGETLVHMRSQIRGTAIPFGTSGGEESLTGRFQLENKTDISLQVQVFFYADWSISAEADQPTSEFASTSLTGEIREECTGDIVFQAIDIDSGNRNGVAHVLRLVDLSPNASCSYLITIHAEGAAGDLHELPTLEGWGLAIMILVICFSGWRLIDQLVGGRTVENGLLPSVRRS